MPEYVDAAIPVRRRLLEMEREERAEVVNALLAELDLRDWATWKVPGLPGNYGCSVLGYSFLYRELTKDECRIRNVESGYMLEDISNDVERLID